MPPQYLDEQTEARAERGKQAIKRYKKATTDSGNFDSLYEEIAKRLFPQHVGTFNSQGMNLGEGQKNTQDLVDATGIVALQKFSAFCESTITPRNARWHYLIDQDKTLRRNRAVQAYWDDTTDVLFKYRNKTSANFASQTHQHWQGLGAYGTNFVYVDRLDRAYGNGLRYKSLHLGGLAFDENHQGIVDTMCRNVPGTTVRHVVQMFTKDSDVLPAWVKEKVEQDKLDEKVELIQCVYPRADYEPGRLDERGQRYISQHVLMKGQWLVREGGFHTWPFPGGRYSQAPGEKRGRGPAIFCLPSLKLLNEQKKTVIKQGHRSVDPVIFTHDDGVVDAWSLRPGAINGGGVSGEGRPLFATLPVGNLALAKEMMQGEAYFINDAFLITLFQIFVETPEMTATEVLERAREKGALLSPTMGRQESEFLGPMVERELDVLNEQGLLPPKPAILAEAEAEYEVYYDSPLSRLQRAEKGSGFARSIMSTAELVKVTGDQSLLDIYDLETAQAEMAVEIHGVPVRWMSTPEKLAGKRKARAEQIQMQQMIDAAPAAASVAKTMQGANAA